MQQIAHLTANLTLEYLDSRGKDRCADLHVEYSFDGADDLAIIGITGSYSDWDADLIDDLIYEHLEEYAPEAYAEWLAERGEYLADAALDRRAAA